MKKRLRNEPFFLFIIYLHHICYMCYTPLVMIHNNTTIQELNMEKTQLNSNWEVEVKEDSYTSSGEPVSTIFLGSNDYSNTISIHLRKNGTADISIYSHENSNNKHVRLSKQTHNLNIESDVQSVAKITNLSSRKTRVSFNKFSPKR